MEGMAARVFAGLAISATALALSACSADTAGLGPGSRADASARDAFPRDVGFADAAVRPDGGLVDAGMRTGRYWTLEERPQQTQLYPRNLMRFPVGTAFVDVAQYPYNICEHAGPAIIEITGDHQAHVRAWFWIEHPPDPNRDCPGITDQVRRTIPVVLTPAGTWAIFGPQPDNILRIEMYNIIDCAGTPTNCEAGCDCSATESCVYNEQGRPSLCGVPCNPIDTGCCGSARPFRDLECPAFEECRARPGEMSARCIPRQMDACGNDGDCPPGMRCPASDAPRTCVWGVALSGAARHVCSDDADCESGLVCVEGSGGSRSCDVPCFTAKMACPAQHSCQQIGLFTRSSWICEWDGE